MTKNDFRSASLAQFLNFFYFMRSGFFIFSLALLPFFTQAQKYAELPNNEFDKWDADEYTVTDWVTVESIFKGDYGMVDRETTDKVNGTASATLTSNDFGIGPFYSFLSCGTGRYSTSPTGIALQGIPYTDTPGAVWVLYKSQPSEKDTPAFLINLYQNRTGVQEGIVQQIVFLETASEWRLAKTDLRSKYLKKESPDSIVFTLYSSYSKAADRKVGTKLQVDGVYFNEPSPLGLKDMDIHTGDFRVYPNPCAAKALQLKSAEDVRGLNFELHGFNGVQRKKVRLRNDFSNEINVADLLPGAYLWLLTDEQGRIVRKGKCILI